MANHLDWLKLPSLVAELVCSNLASAPDATVQAVFQGGDYSVDVQIECEPESTELAVVGQIVDRSDADQPMPNLPVVLMARKKMLCRSQSNRFGEFCLVSKIETGLKLCLPISALGKQLEIPLTEVIAGLE